MKIYIRLGVEASVGVSVESGDFSVQRQQEINCLLLWRTLTTLRKRKHKRDKSDSTEKHRHTARLADTFYNNQSIDNAV